MVVKTRQDSGTRIATQARDYLRNPNWRHAGVIYHIGVAFPRVFRRIGECRYPPYVHSMVARDLFDI